MAVDGVPFGIIRKLSPSRKFRRVSATTVTFKQLRLELLQSVRIQVSQLRRRVEAAALLVIINDWPNAECLWWELLPDLKEPLMTLNFLPEVAVTPPDKAAGAAQFIGRHTEQLTYIMSEVESSCERRDNLELSDALEQWLIPWLDELSHSLKQWQEKAAA